MSTETYADYLARQAERDAAGVATVSEDYWTRALQAMADRRAIEGVQQYQDQQSAEHQGLLARNADNLGALSALAPAEQAAHVRRVYEPLSRQLDARNATAGDNTYARVTDAPTWYVPPADPASGVIQQGVAAGALNYGGGYAEGGEVSPYDERAHAAWTSPRSGRTPTQAQIKAGNYGKGHAHINGMRVSIENPQGSIRRGTSPSGDAWASPLFSHYGYIRGTAGADKDHIDAFVGPLAGDGDLPVYVIDQHGEDGAFDEHKVMLGYADEAAARQGYLDNYPDGWKGLGAITAMPLGAFKKWAYQPGRRDKALSAEIAHYAQGGAVCKPCADAAALAEGGPIEEKPYLGNPNLTRQGKRANVQSRSNTLTDPVTALVRGLLGEMPDEFGSVLDPNRSANLGAAEAGAVLGTALMGAPLVRPLVRGAKGALTLMGESAGAARPAGVKRGQASSVLMSRPGDDELVREFLQSQPGALDSVTLTAVERLHTRPPQRELGAVKLPGGNWLREPKDVLIEYGFGEGAVPAVQAWRDKQLTRYIKNDLGTARDPLIKLEQEGRLHLTPEQLEDMSAEFTVNGNNSARLKPFEPKFHKQQTGRHYATPWEMISDQSIGMFNKGPGYNIPEWAEKLPEGTPLHFFYESSDHGFQHIFDYLNAATRAHGAGAADPLVARGLAIDPAKLDRMSVPDVVGKVSDWNKMLAQAKQLEDMNKGIKSVLKAYPDSGHQWVELAPEGLEAEGAAMRHCVGGYCRSVEDGSARILSLRDKDGRPAVTVELAPGKGWNEQPGWFSERADLEAPWAAYYRQQGGNATPAVIQGFPTWLEKTHPELFAKYAKDFAPAPQEIRQIKGPANRAPSKEVLGMVQDLVRNMGPWGRVSDLQNTGLKLTRDGKYLTEKEVVEDLAGQLRENGYNEGGEVFNFREFAGLEPSASAAPPPEEDTRPEWQRALAAEEARVRDADQPGGGSATVQRGSVYYTPATYGAVSTDMADPRQIAKLRYVHDYDAAGTDLGERVYARPGALSSMMADMGPALALIMPALGGAGLGLTSGLTGAAGDALSGLTGLSRPVADVLVNAVGRGAMAEAQGGDFLKAAASGVVGSALPGTGSPVADAALSGAVRSAVSGGNPLVAALTGAVGAQYGPLGAAALKLARGQVPVIELIKYSQQQGALQ